MASDRKSWNSQGNLEKNDHRDIIILRVRYKENSPF